MRRKNGPVARALTLVLVALVSIGSSVVTAAVPASATSNHGEAVVSLFDWLNAERTGRGLPALRWDSELADLSTTWSQQMVSDGQISHDPNAAESAFARGYTRAGENVGFDPVGRQVVEVHVALMESAGHRANILQPGFSAIGIGVSCGSDGLYITQKFAGKSEDGDLSHDVPPQEPIAVRSGGPSVQDVCDGGPGGPSPSGQQGGARFNDVPSDHPFKQDIAWAEGQGITSGYSDGTFRPADIVTRDQMATFLARARKLGPAPRDYFSDDNGSVHESNINRVAHAGISSGKGDGNFDVKGAVTRGQMAAFITRAFNLKKASRDYFGDDNGSIFEDAINRVAEAGITSGRGDGTYGLSDLVTRGQMTAFLHRAS